MSRRQAGFSLLDVVFVVVLLVVIMTLAAGASFGALANYRLNASSLALASKLFEARTEALKRSRPVWLLLDASAGTLQLQTQNGAVVQNLGSSEFLARDVTFQGFAGPRQVGFDAIGRPLATPEVVTLGNAARTATVTVWATGSVTVG